jgi:hypothetical protein
MSTKRASSHDHEGRQNQPLSTRPGKAVPGKRPRAKKVSAVDTQNVLPGGVEQESKTPSANGDVQARITERAYELYHRRGGHHGQDLDDWFAAEQEILAEDPLED